MKDKNVCPNCGVILDEGVRECPLCHHKKEIAGSEQDKELYPSDILHLSEKKSRIHAWELSAIIALSANLICLIVDMVIGKGINWSLYAITAITCLWLFITSFTFFLKKPVMLGLSLTLSTLGTLLIIDILNPPITWFTGIGLPVTVTFWLLFGIFLVLYRKLRYKGFNILAFILIEISALCIVIDLFTDMHLRDSIFIDWSAITAATLVPLAGILLFVHYRMKRGKDLGSFFHV